MCDSVKLLLWHIEPWPLLQQVTPIKRGGDTDIERKREGNRERENRTGLKVRQKDVTIEGGKRIKN